MNFVRNQTRLSCDIYNAFRSLNVIENIIKWTDAKPLSIHGEEHSHVEWSVVNEQGVEIQMKFNIMNCAVKTRYCTEIHLISMVNEENSSEVDAFSKRILEQLRQKHNNAWVILDRDLTDSILK